MRAALRFISSLKLGIALLVLITIACIHGSMVSSVSVERARAEVFHTPWFLGLLGLLAVNLVLCSWEKSYIALTLHRKKNFIASPRFFEKARHAYIFPWRGNFDAVAAVARKKYTVAHRKDDSLYAQRGITGRYGATIIHIGLLWTMAAGGYRILADDFGWGVYDATVILPEGQSTVNYYTRIDRLQDPTADNLRERDLPFSLRGLDFAAEMYPNSTVARHFASTVELRDGGKSIVREITMTDPLVYKGFKITQNSYTTNDRIVRGRYRVVDEATSETVVVDLSPNDPVIVNLPKRKNLFLQVAQFGEDQPWQILDLSQRSLVAEGTVARELQPGELDDNAIARQLVGKDYAFVITAMFPNFRIDDQKRPTTLDEKFDNPAAYIALYKMGQPNGSMWLFQNKTAQEIVGQPHPEIEALFVAHRLRSGATGSNGLLDYEVQIRIKEKATARVLGEFWAVPGSATAIPGVSETIRNSAPISQIQSDPHAETTTGSQVADSVATSTAQLQDNNPILRGGAAAPTSGGGESFTQAASAARAARSDTLPPVFTVQYLGQTTGHVSFLGFMKDPSVLWIFAGCFIVFLGTVVAFIINHREVWIAYDEQRGIMYMATQVRHASPACYREFDRLAKTISGMSEPDTADSPVETPHETAAAS